MTPVLWLVVWFALSYGFAVLAYFQGRKVEKQDGLRQVIRPLTGESIEVSYCIHNKHVVVGVRYKDARTELWVQPAHARRIANRLIAMAAETEHNLNGLGAVDVDLRELGGPDP